MITEKVKAKVKAKEKAKEKTSYLGQQPKPEIADEFEELDEYIGYDELVKQFSFDGWSNEQPDIPGDLTHL